MSYYLYQVDDACRTTFEACASLDDWLDAIQDLHDQCEMEQVSDLMQEVWPLWVTATEKLALPLSYLFKGELYKQYEPGCPDVGFIGAPLVKEIAVHLRQPDSWFDELLTKEWGSPAPGEMLLLPILREFYTEAASSGKAVVLLLMPS